MKIINLLIIDDSPDIAIIKNMCNELSLVGYQVRPFWINPQDTIYQKGNRNAQETIEAKKIREARELQESSEEKEAREQEELKADKTKFDKALKKMLIINEIHLIACDYGLGADFVTGIDVLAHIRHKFNFKGVNLLFSSQIDALLYEILESENHNLESRKEMLKKLVRSYSIEFPVRDDLAQTLKGIIKNTKLGDINHRDEILRWLYAFKDHSFNGHPDLERKTCGEIAEAIEMETSLGIQFQKLLIEQGLSTMIKLNKLPANE